MPNQPRTPARSIRIPDDLWRKAKEQAKKNRETVTAVIVRALRRYTGEAEE